MSARQSLRRRHPRRVDVPLLALLSLVTLAIGVTQPALVFDNLVGDETFSVLSGIWGFVTSGNLLLALLLFGFSVLFPIGKLVAILVLWLVPARESTRREAVEWLELLGKWSLLDAFVITVVIGSVQLGWLSEAHAAAGAYVYLAAILLSLLATLLLSTVVPARAEPARPFARLGLLLTAPAAALYVLGVVQPLLEVEKAWFWANRYSLLDGVGELWRSGQWGLAVVLTGFVVVLPGARFVLLLTLRAAAVDAPRWRVRLLALDRWSTLDVFALALLIVFTKLGSLATPTPLPGMWLLLGAAALSLLDSVLLRRLPRSDEPADGDDD
ncbi:MAG: paraquat-inducible protein A [Planctomycetes bacterium]|nr:paraquat-inducible protein A [Planctomycetota bacterium]